MTEANESESKVSDDKDASGGTQSFVELRLSVSDISKVYEIVDLLKARKIRDELLKARKIRDEVETLLRIAASTSQVVSHPVVLNSTVEDSGIQIGLTYRNDAHAEKRRQADQEARGSRTADIPGREQLKPTEEN